ncbi:MAG: PLP-dependent aminotransferase family protein [Lachnospiraceae bacterium]|nr:PLP-dependent aminotransferase family protein [Lachnospiraceae bacterium]
MSIKDEIENEIIDMIRKGALASGEKIPSIRKMSETHACSITPVTDAYASLVSKHIIESKRGSGYVVSTQISEYNDGFEATAPTSLFESEHYRMVDDFLKGYSQIAMNSSNDLSHPFGATSVYTRFFPEEEFRQIMVAAIRSGSSPGNYQAKTHDEMKLKRNLMRWMLPTECTNTIDDLSIVRSTSEGVTLSILACLQPGMAVAIESPGHAGFYFSARFLNCKIIPAPSNPKTGLDVDAFERILDAGAKICCLVLCSTNSNPTGATMPDENKARLCRLCAEYGVTIIEDDISGELYFGEKRPRPLKSFDNDNVIYVSGFGKCLQPVVRLGYVSAGRLKDRFAFFKHLNTAYAYPYLQDAVSDMIESGIAGNYVKVLRKQLKKFSTKYINLIQESFPEGTTIAPSSGGPYLWVTLPDGLNADTLGRRARMHGISIAPGRLFYTPPGLSNITGKTAEIIDELVKDLDVNSSFRFNCLAVDYDDDAFKAVSELGKEACNMIK